MKKRNYFRFSSNNVVSVGVNFRGKFARKNHEKFSSEERR